jgi:hypothetical protein
MRTTPAIGVATVFGPRRNFAKSRDRAPCFSNISSARRTQESSSSEIRHSIWRTLIPFVRPSSYQMVSGVIALNRHNNSATAMFSRPSPANAPAASKSGTDGIGSPPCSANTQTNTTRYPCRRMNFLRGTICAYFETNVAGSPQAPLITNSASGLRLRGATSRSCNCAGRESGSPP